MAHHENSITQFTTDEELERIVREGHGQLWTSMNELRREMALYDADLRRQELIDAAEIERMCAEIKRRDPLPKTATPTTSQPIPLVKMQFHEACRDMAKYAQAKFKHLVAGVSVHNWELDISQTLTADMLYDVEHIMRIATAAFKNQSK